MPIRHTFVSAIPDDPAAAAAGDVLTQSHWNADHSGDHDPVTVGTGLDVTGQLVELDLSEVAAGGELGGFLNAPTVDATHSGSTHAATQAAAETTASGALTTHAGAADPHTGYRLESADHSHASTGLQAGTIAHSATTGQTANDHHAQLHAASHQDGGADEIDVTGLVGAGGATPDLAAVLVEGNDPDGNAIEGAAGGVGVAGGSVDIKGGIGNAQDNSGAEISINGGEADGAGGNFGMYAGKGGPGVAGGSASISGGAGDDENDNGASLTIGGGDGAGTDGAITATGSAFTFNGQPWAAGLQSVTIDLDAADIATLNSVPVEVVAAPGATRAIIPLIASFQYLAGAVAYEETHVGLRLGTTGVSMTFNDANLNDTVTTLSSVVGLGLGNPQIDLANQPLMIDADFEPDGAGDGTARLTVLYYVMNLL